MTSRATFPLAFLLVAAAASAGLGACSAEEPADGSANGGTTGGTTGTTSGATTGDTTGTTAGSGGDTTSGSGGTTTGGTTEEDDGGPRGPFELRSTAFVPDTTLPDTYTCDGANKSPPLQWTRGPVGTKSYALILNDRTINFLHSAMYDIPELVRELPADVDQVAEPPDVPGAKQTANYTGPTKYGYAGPCPTGTHTYDFTLYALDVETLPGLSATSTRAQARTAMEAHKVATATLSAKYTR